MDRRWGLTGCIFKPLPPLPLSYTGPGSALTYGKRWDEPYGKIFLLCTDYNTGLYRFFKAPAYFVWTGQTIFLDWEELPAPPIPNLIPQADAAICYLFNSISLEEKVLAVFAGERSLWIYDVPSRQWRQEIALEGNELPGQGASMVFGGFRWKDEWPVNTFYLIKGGGSYEFMAYNRPYIPAKGNFPYWEMLAPFPTGPFQRGADLAMYHPDPYQSPAPDTIFATRGGGKDFGLYRISENRWYPRDSILGDGAFLGGALVSHIRWGDIRDDDRPLEKEPPVYDVMSILHCFRGEDRDENPTKQFDCYDVSPGGPERWNYDAPNPDYYVSSGSDLCFGGIWYRYNNEVRYKDCIWASFGGKVNLPGWYIGIHYLYRFPWQPDVEPGGAQSEWTISNESDLVKVLPNPAHHRVLFQLSSNNNGTVLIYSKTGQLVRSLTLNAGETTWDLKDDDDTKVPAGIYFYQVKAGGKEARGKLAVGR